jgi:hypothetical protein
VCGVCLKVEVLGSAVARAGIDLLFFKTMPSDSAVTDVLLWPMSITSAVGFPCEYLYQQRSAFVSRAIEDSTYAANCPVFARKKAGTPHSSIAISIVFSLAFCGFQPGSLINKGYSPSTLSCSSVCSAAPSAMAESPFSSLSSFSPFLLGGVCREPVNLDVMLYSHNLVAVSQSSTTPSLLNGLRISMSGRGRWIAFSPNSFSPEDNKP